MTKYCIQFNQIHKRLGLSIGSRKSGFGPYGGEYIVLFVFIVECLNQSHYWIKVLIWIVKFDEGMDQNWTVGII